jgi:hypothetical protein
LDWLHATSEITHKKLLKKPVGIKERKAVIALLGIKFDEAWLNPMI